MQSFIITSKDPQTREQYILKLCNERGVDALDIEIIKPGESIGITEVRSLQKNLFLKPLRGKMRATILQKCDTITIPAQNALLKILEEPPQTTLIILSVSQKEILLPTILSRCEIIELKNVIEDITGNEVNQYTADVLSLVESGTGTKLKRAQDLSKNKDETAMWLEKTIITCREKMIEDIFNDNNETMKQLRNMLVSFQKTLIILKTTNVAPRFALENLFLSIT